MKKISYIIAGLFAVGLSSCSDMLDVESDMLLPSDGGITNKTDSVFYTFGIMSAMQQLADTYVLQNELRGDLVSLTSSADLDLQELANFSADGTNAYDSAYVYYRVINNVNNYLAHRDTTLADGATNLVTNEYGAMLAFRAWAYLQAVRQYGKVKYVTRPLTSISDIENDNSPEVDIYQLASNLIPELEKYAGNPVPDYGNINCGSGNNNMVGSKTVSSFQSFIPVDVILGELYLERGQEGDYLRAAQHFYTYIDRNASTRFLSNLISDYSYNWFVRSSFNRPTDFTTSISGSWGGYWSTQTFTNQSTQIVSQIPMAQNYMLGATTSLPLLYGFNYYTANDDSVYTAVQVVPSSNYFAIADSTDCYYTSTVTVSGRNPIHCFRARDSRYYETFIETQTRDSVMERMSKFDTGNIILYRNTTIWLRLAEALNRAGYPDAAFAILKDGLKSTLLNSNDYLSPETETLLTTTIPICDVNNVNDQYYIQNVGIHAYGAAYYESVSSGINNGPIGGTYSTYTMDSIVGLKMDRLAREFAADGVVIGATKADTINAVEDLICDEYAMEFAFEGTRFSDITRLARRKNREAPTNYGANFGGKWIARKLAYKNPAKQMDQEANWYLPFK